METVIHTATGRIFGGRFQCEKPLKVAPGTATWLGRDLEQDLPVVIKTVTLAEMTPAAHIRLEHEARVLADIESSCLTPVIDVGRENGQAYIVTPAISGVTLETRLARGPLSLPESLLVGRSLGAALQHVHDRGVLHRDIKPSNIIVDHGVPLSRVTLIDFGFARSTHLDPAIRDIPVGTVRMSARPAGAPAVAISISDHGSGMPPAIQTRLFQPFVTTKPPRRGPWGVGVQDHRRAAPGRQHRREIRARERHHRDSHAPDRRRGRQPDARIPTEAGG